VCLVCFSYASQEAHPNELSMTFAVPPRRRVSQAIVHEHPLQEFLQLKTQEVYDTLSEEVFELAEKISLADLLISDVSRCEVISMLSNIPKYWRYYEVNNDRESQIVSQLGDIKDLVPRKCAKSAFSAIARLKDETRTSRIEVSAATNRQKQLEKPIIQRAEPLNESLLKDYICKYVEKVQKGGKHSFKYEALCTWINNQHTKNGNLKLAASDLAQCSAHTPTWRSAISNALQKFQDHDLIKYRKAKDDWFIFPD